MARPKKPPGEKKTAWLQVKLTADEAGWLQLIREKSPGRDLSKLTLRLFAAKSKRLGIAIPPTVAALLKPPPKPPAPKAKGKGGAKGSG